MNIHCTYFIIDDYFSFGWYVLCLLNDYDKWNEYFYFFSMNLFNWLKFTLMIFSMINNSSFKIIFINYNYTTITIIHMKQKVCIIINTLLWNRSSFQCAIQKKKICIQLKYNYFFFLLINIQYNVICISPINSKIKRDVLCEKNEELFLITGNWKTKTKKRIINKECDERNINTNRLNFNRIL